MERLTPERAATERGMILFLALVMLAILSIAAVAVVRSLDTANLIAGNFAFKQAAMQASDRAITDALNNLSNIVVGDGGNTPVANRYFATRQTAVDSLGVPTAVNWAGVACADERGVAVTDCSDASRYRIQYVIERQCDTNPNLASNTDIKTHCDYEVRQTTPTEQIAVHYRVIVRARGPRDAQGIYEVMVSGPATS